MVESVGKKLSQARLARGLTIEEVAHATRLRPDKVIGLETDDYSRFGSNAYARGFLQIYGRYLGVDVTWHVKALEDPHRVSVAEYQYLNSAPEPANVRTPSRREIRPPSMVPAFVFMTIVLFLGTGFYIYISAQRLGLSGDTSTMAATTTVAPQTAQTASTPADDRAVQQATLTPVPASNPAPAEVTVPQETPAADTEIRVDSGTALPTASATQIGQNVEPIAYNAASVNVR